MNEQRVKKLVDRLETIHKRIDCIAHEESKSVRAKGLAARGHFMEEKEHLVDEAEKVVDKLEEIYRKN